MASTGKRLIPVDLLRRSTRLRTIAHDEFNKPIKVEKQLTQLVTDDAKTNSSSSKLDQTIDKLAIKIEPVQSEHSHVESRLDFKKPQQESSSTPPPVGKTLVLEPDGYLSVAEDELDLERTLLGGQSFRWVKSIASGETSHTATSTAAQLVFSGVVGNNALQLWRSDAQNIAFRKLNREGAQGEAIKQFLTDYFQLKYKLTALYEDWSHRDKHFKKCSEFYTGFRILRQHPVENLFSFICATNNNIKRISQMIDKMCYRFGTILETKPSSDEKDVSVYDAYRAFPSIQRLAEDDVFDCLRYDLGFGYRAKFICETAKKIISLSESCGKSPDDYLLSLRQIPYKETCKQLQCFPGIGRKVADCICLMSMDHLNSVPIDCHIYDIVCRNYMPTLRQERKALTESLHDLIGSYFIDLHGPLAGWATSVLFIAELKHLKQSCGDARTNLKKAPKNKRQKRG